MSKASKSPPTKANLIIASIFQATNKHKKEKKS